MRRTSTRLGRAGLGPAGEATVIPVQTPFLVQPSAIRATYVRSDARTTTIWGACDDGRQAVHRAHQPPLPGIWPPAPGGGPAKPLRTSRTKSPSSGTRTAGPPRPAPPRSRRLGPRDANRTSRAAVGTYSVCVWFTALARRARLATGRALRFTGVSARPPHAMCGHRSPKSWPARPASGTARTWRVSAPSTPPDLRLSSEMWPASNSSREK